MSEKQTNKERIKEITDSIETGIQELFESDKYKSYLQTMSRFHKYSFNNTMLISMQMPHATQVAGFNKWRDGFSRHVKKGEKGIKIIAPTPYKVKEEQTKLDPVTKVPLLDTNGKIQTEEVERQIPMFRVVSVFDVSQTEGEPLPTLASDLTGNVAQYELFMEAIKRTAPVPIFLEKMPDDTDGYYHIEDKHIAIREGMSEVQTISATIHEVAHSILHSKQAEQERQAQQSETAKPVKPKNRNTEEVEAESISYAVCNYYGIETAENSLGYIATWSKGKELSELRSSLELINKTCSELITGIDTHFAELIKEYGIVAEKDTELSELDTLALQIDDFLLEHNSVVIGENDQADRLAELKGFLETGQQQDMKYYITEVGNITNRTKEATELVMLIDEYGDRNYPEQLSYQMDDHYLTIQAVDDGYDYSFLDKDFNLLDGGVYDDPSITIYEAIHEIAEIDTGFALWNKEGISTVDFEEITEKADNVAMSKIVGTIKYSDVTTEFNRLAPNFVDRDMPLYTNTDGDKYVLGYGSAAEDGTVVWNYLGDTDGDYTTIAIIDNIGNIRYRDDNVPDLAKAEITKHAEHIRSKNDPNRGSVTEKGYQIAVDNYYGTWYVVDAEVINDRKYFLLEHEEYGDEAGYIIVDIDGKSVLDDVWNGFDDLKEHFESIATHDSPTHELEGSTGYPMPDSTVTITDRNQYGYTSDELLPLRKEKAFELFENDVAVFLLYPDNTETMAFDVTEIDSHAGYFGIEKADRENYYEFKETEQLQWATTEKQEQAFLDSKKDCYAIYQLKNGEEYHHHRFTGTEELKQLGLEIDRDNYNLVYMDELQNCSYIDQALNALYHDFNVDRPVDFKGHSLSVSDIIALNMDGIVSSHYVDSFGFKEQPLFLRDIEIAELIGEDYIFVDEQDGSVVWMCFNEDGSDGGHFVENNFDLSEVLKVSKEATNHDEFWGDLGERAMQYLGDVGTEHFYHMKAKFISGTHQLSGMTEQSMQELVKIAENYLAPTELSTEQNYNMVDGVVNNLPTVAELEYDAKNGKPISLMDLLDATRREQKEQPKKEKTAPTKGVEMER